MAWTTWANNEAKEAAMSEFQQNLAGLGDFYLNPQQYLKGQWLQDNNTLWFQKMVKISFFARFVLGGGTQEGKTYDDVAEFMTNTVYPAYENVDGIFATAACKVDDNSGFSFNFWTIIAHMQHLM